MIGDLARWFFKTETSFFRSFQEVIVSLGLLSIFATFLSVIYILNPYIIVKAINKKYAKKN